MNMNSPYWRPDPFNSPESPTPLSRPVPPQLAQWQLVAERCMRALIQQLVSQDPNGVNAAYTALSGNNFMNPLWARAVESALEIADYILQTGQAQQPSQAVQGGAELSIKLFVFNEIQKFPQIRQYCNPMVLQDLQQGAQCATNIAAAIDRAEQQYRTQMQPQSQMAGGYPIGGNQQQMYGYNHNQMVTAAAYSTPPSRATGSQWDPIVGSNRQPQQQQAVQQMSMPGTSVRLSPGGKVPQAPVAAPAPDPFKNEWNEVTLEPGRVTTQAFDGKTDTFIGGFVSSRQPASALPEAPVAAPQFEAAKVNSNPDEIVWRPGDTIYIPMFNDKTHYLDESGNLRKRPMEYNAHQLDPALRTTDTSAGIKRPMQIEAAPLDTGDDTESTPATEIVELEETLVIDDVVVGTSVDAAIEIIGELHNITGGNRAIEFAVLEAKPFVIGNQAKEDFRLNCAGLFTSSPAKSVSALVTEINKVAAYNDRLFRYLEKLATQVVNDVLASGLGLVGEGGGFITSFLEDWMELPAYLRENYGEAHFEALRKASPAIIQRIAVLADPQLEEHYLRFTTGSLEHITNSGIKLKGGELELMDTKAITAQRRQDLANEERKTTLNNTVLLLNLTRVVVLPVSSHDLSLNINEDGPSILSEEMTPDVYHCVNGVYSRSVSSRLPASSVCLSDWAGDRLYINPVYLGDPDLYSLS